MIEIEKPRIDCEQLAEDGSYGKFVVEPLERGYGTTLGNSLRRILLSSLPGTAASSIKIAGVQHEFSTIPGVKEDVTEIVLNVKGIIAKLHCDGPKTVYIEAAGEGEVKAGDIHADGEVEILNPDLHIATLMSDARLSMEITMTSGRGYVPAEKNKQHQTSIGVIPVDSIYTPVYKVNYTVENTRVRDLTDYDNNYVTLSRSLARIAELLTEQGLKKEAAAFLEFGIATHTDIGKNYTLLAGYYMEYGKPEKIDFLIAQAEQLSSLSKDPIIARLKAIQRGETSPA